MNQVEKKPLWKKWWFWLIAIIVIGRLAPNQGAGSNSSGSSGAALASGSNSSFPPDEMAFIKAAALAQAESDNAENDMQRGGIKATRDKAICKLLKKKLKIKDWKGTISTLDANSDGKGVLGIQIFKNVIITTWNNDLSDSEDNTLLDPNSDFFKAVSKLSVGKFVTFSGSFRPGSDGECIKESSFTLSGKLREPEFIFQFSDLSF